MGNGLYRKPIQDIEIHFPLQNQSPRSHRAVSNGEEQISVQLSVANCVALSAECPGADFLTHTEIEMFTHTLNKDYRFGFQLNIVLTD